MLYKCGTSDYYHAPSNHGVHKGQYKRNTNSLFFLSLSYKIEKNSHLEEELLTEERRKMWEELLLTPQFFENPEAFIISAGELIKMVWYKRE